jgi:exodeoxyribonuclease VII large subunit
VEHGRQRLQVLEGRLRHAWSARSGAAGAALRLRGDRLVALHPRQRLAALAHRRELLVQRLAAAWSRRSDAAGARLQRGGGLLHSLSPLATLSRGYAILRDDAGRVLRDAAQVQSGDAVEATLSAGRLALRVEASLPPPAPTD